MHSMTLTIVEEANKFSQVHHLGIASYFMLSKVSNYFLLFDVIFVLILSILYSESCDECFLCPYSLSIKTPPSGGVINIHRLKSKVKTTTTTTTNKLQGYLSRIIKNSKNATEQIRLVKMQQDSFTTSKNGR